MSVAGHSLGSVILIDILMHQKVSDELGSFGSTATDTAPAATPAPSSSSITTAEVLEQRGVGSVLTASSLRAKVRVHYHRLG